MILTNEREVIKMKMMSCKSCELSNTCDEKTDGEFGRCLLRDRLLGIPSEFYQKELNILKCAEKDLKNNIQILIDNDVELPNNHSIVAKGEYFYLFLYDRNEVKSLPFVGIFI